MNVYHINIFASLKKSEKYDERIDGIYWIVMH